MIHPAQPQPADERPTIIIGDGLLGVDELLEVVDGRARVELSDAPAFRETIERSRAAFLVALERGDAIYGVTTGYGGSCGNRLDAGSTAILGRNLLRYHGCGFGDPLPIPGVRGALLSRLLCFAQGVSGVTWGLMEQLVAFLNLGITPVVPEQGSVGASGDLTPMSYVAAALGGEREVFLGAERMPAARALAQVGLPAYELQAKEPLATINGTAVMTGLALHAIARARQIQAGVTASTALTVHALAGQVDHFHVSLFDAKPFPGAQQVAAGLRGWLAGEGIPPVSDSPEDLQDAYSLRCTPQVLGVLADALRWVEEWVTIEANGADDNPIVDPDSGRLVMGGNFYGGHIALAMDSLKAALASAADLCDRQVARLVDARFSRGLPEGLLPVPDGSPRLHHGFKGLQITASALTAEALQATMPSGSFSRSTESHNQDKVSMGTIAARSALSVCGLVEGVVAAHLLIAAQGAELRRGLDARPRLLRLVTEVRSLAAPLTGDVPLDRDLIRLTRAVAEGELAFESHPDDA